MQNKHGNIPHPFGSLDGGDGGVGFAGIWNICNAGHNFFATVSFHGVSGIAPCKMRTKLVSGN